MPYVRLEVRRRSWRWNVAPSTPPACVTVSYHEWKELKEAQAYIAHQKVEMVVSTILIKFVQKRGRATFEISSTFESSDERGNNQNRTATRHVGQVGRCRSHGSAQAR